MRQGMLALAGLVFAATSALVVGCDTESKLTVVVEEGATAPTVNLPAVPTLPPPPPARHTDGSYTLWGVRHDALRTPADVFNKQQRVHGFIVTVYAPRTPEGRICTQNDRCNEERPHVYIADARNERDPQRMMMVTGYAMFQFEIDDAKRAARSGRTPTPAQAQMQQAGLQRAIPTDFDEGAEIVVTGNFTRRAANGQADSNGLIEYTSHTTVTPAPPAPAARR